MQTNTHKHMNALTHTHVALSPPHTPTRNHPHPTAHPHAHTYIHTQTQREKVVHSATTVPFIQTGAGRLPPPPPPPHPSNYITLNSKFLSWRVINRNPQIYLPGEEATLPFRILLGPVILYWSAIHALHKVVWVTRLHHQDLSRLNHFQDTILEPGHILHLHRTKQRGTKIISHPGANTERRRYTQREKKWDL